MRRGEKENAPSLCKMWPSGNTPHLTAHLPLDVSFPAAKPRLTSTVTGESVWRGDSPTPTLPPTPTRACFQTDAGSFRRQGGHGGPVPGGLGVPGSRWAHEQEERGLRACTPLLPPTPQHRPQPPASGHGHGHGHGGCGVTTKPSLRAIRT